MLRRFEQVDLTEEQLHAFNKLSFDLRTRIDEKRAKVGITGDTIKTRDEHYSQLKKTHKGDELWNTLQEQAKFADEQIAVFRETQEHYKKFRNAALSLLTAEQKKRLPKRKPKK